MNTISLRLDDRINSEGIHNRRLSNIPFYEMVEDLLVNYYINYSGMPYKEGVNYPEGSLVYRNGIIYRSIKTNSIDPISPAGELYWTIQEEFPFDEESKYIEDNYNTFYNIIKYLSKSNTDVITRSWNYTSQELRWIANYIYQLKGSYISIAEFCRLFNIDINFRYVDYELNVDFQVKDIAADDLDKFKLWFERLCFELLFYDSLKFSFINIHFNCIMMNDLSVATSTSLLNSVKLNLSNIN